MSLNLILILSLNAISVVLILMLIALGLYVVLGLMGVINLAHGEFYMLGAYDSVMVSSMGLSSWWGLLLSPILLVIVALITEATLIRHLYSRPLETVLATWGLSIILRQAVEIIFGKDFQYVSHPMPGAISLFGLRYPSYRLFIMAIALTLLLLSFLILQRSTWGLRIRAAISNPDLAKTLGIDIRQIYRFTFAFGAATAGFAGALMAPLVSVSPNMGLDIVLDAFFVVIIGGLGHLLSVVLGSFAIGGLQSLLSFLSDPVTARVVVLIFAVIIIQIRPKGFFAS